MRDSEWEAPRQPPRIPPDRAAEFDLVVDIAIRPRSAFEGKERSLTRIRVPLDKARYQRAYINQRIHEEIGNQLNDQMVLEGDPGA